MRSYILIATIFIGALLYSNKLISQISTGGTPISFDLKDLKSLKATKLPKVNLKKVLQEDKENPGNTRFTKPIATDFDFNTAGEWTELENGDRIWRFKIESKDALGLMVLYDNFHLPVGAKLFMYSEDQQQVLGAYTHRNNKATKRFMTGLIYGSSAVLEYYEPKAVKDQGYFHIFRIDHAYHLANMNEAKSTDLGFGASDLCNVNVNCPQADELEDQKRSVCRIYLVVAEGIGYCSGALMNNTSMDGTPYVLSAFHCMDGYTPLYDMWRFDFNFEGTGCLNPFQEPAFNSIVGCEYKAGRQENDFLLLEISTSIPNSYDVYLNGWDRTGDAPDTSMMIHHPRGDIKKFSQINQQATIHPFQFEWDNGTFTPPNLNYRTVFSLGTFEGGSSGAPMFDKEGLVIAQLHGGFIHCEGSVGYFGRLSRSWEGGGTPETRLKDWLDPINSGDLSMDGMDYEVTGEGIIAGYVTNEIGVGIQNVEVSISGAETAMTITDSEGYYEFAALSLGGVYSISLSKNTNPKNGVSTFDLVKITQHIISAVPLSSPYKILASDVNDTGNVSTLDLIFIRKVILGIDPVFPAVPSWTFVPFDYEFDDPTNPFLNDIPTEVIISSFSEDIMDLDWTAIKMGDVNNSANPGE